MIVSTFLAIVQALIDFFLGILPTDTTGFVPFITTGFNYLISTLWAFNFILPVSDILQVLQWSITFSIAVMAFKIIEWIIRKVPFLNIK